MGNKCRNTLIIILIVLLLGTGGFFAYLYIEKLWIFEEKGKKEKE